MELTRDLQDGKVGYQKIAVTAGAPVSIDLLDDSKGIKIYSDKDLFFNLNEAPSTDLGNGFLKGGFCKAEIIEVRILQDGSQRKLFLSADENANVIVECWG